MESLISLLKEFGEVNGLLILGILFLFRVVWKLNQRVHQQHAEQLADRQREIDRLAKENREYRELFLNILGKKFPDETKVQ